MLIEGTHWKCYPEVEEMTPLSSLHPSFTLYILPLPSSYQPSTPADTTSSTYCNSTELRVPHCYLQQLMPLILHLWPTPLIISKLEGWVESSSDWLCWAPHSWASSPGAATWWMSFSRLRSQPSEQARCKHVKREWGGAGGRWWWWQIGSRSQVC